VGRVQASKEDDSSEVISISQHQAPHIPLMIECLKKLKKQGSKTTNQKGTPTEKRVL